MNELALGYCFGTLITLLIVALVLELDADKCVSWTNGAQLCTVSSE